MMFIVSRTLFGFRTEVFDVAFAFLISAFDRCSPECKEYLMLD